MIGFSTMRGVTVIREGELPDALRDMIAGHRGNVIQALAAHDLPPGADDVLGSGPGVTIIITDARRAPVQRASQVRDLIQNIERIADDLRRLKQAGDDTAEAGTVSALQAGLIELAATPAGRNSDVRGKARCVRANMAAADFSPTARAMIEAALAADARAWNIGRTGH